MFSVVLAAASLLLMLAAWLAPTAFIWAFAIVYFGVGAIIVIASAVFMSRQSRNGTDGVQMRLIKDLFEQRLGLLKLPVKAIGWILGAFNWPIQFLIGIYYATVRKSAKSGILLPALGQAMVPSWLQPPVTTAVALILLEYCAHHVAEYPLRAIAYCFVASTILSLLMNSLLGNMKEEALARIGNPRVTFVVVLFATFISAAISRLMLMRWDGQPDSTVIASATAILSLSDWKSILEPRGISLGAVIENPGILQKLADVTAAKWLMALLELLFYSGFARIALDIFKVKRAPAHQLAIGTSSAALGLYDVAEKYLYEARELKNAQVMLCGVRLRNGEFAKLVPMAKRLCATLSVDYSREEEATISSVCTSDVLATDGHVLSNYFRYEPQLFHDPDLPVLLVMIMVHTTSNADKDAFIKAVYEGGALEHRPLFELFLLDLRSVADEVRQGLANIEPTTLAARMIKLWLLASTLLDDQPATAADPAMLAEIDVQVGALGVLEQASSPHWAKIVGHTTVHFVDAMMTIRLGKPYPAIAALRTALRTQLLESELIGDHLRATENFLARENRDLIARMRRPAEETSIAA